MGHFGCLKKHLGRHIDFPRSLNSKVARILSISWVNAWRQSATGTLPTASFGNLHRHFSSQSRWNMTKSFGKVLWMAGMVIKSCCRFLPCVMIWEDSPPIASHHPGGNWNLRKGNASMCLVPLSTIFSTHDQFQGKWSWRCLSHLVSLAVRNLILFRLTRWGKMLLTFGSYTQGKQGYWLEMSEILLNDASAGTWALADIGHDMTSFLLTLHATFGTKSLEKYSRFLSSRAFHQKYRVLIGHFL